MTLILVFLTILPLKKQRKAAKQNTQQQHNTSNPHLYMPYVIMGYEGLFSKYMFILDIDMSKLHSM